MISAGTHPCRITSADASLDGIWLVPEQADRLLVFAHGAGAGYLHPNMQRIAEAMADQHIASLRFNFPFMQAGRRRVDSQEIAVQTVVSAVEFARAHSHLPLFLGGHSFGGRMSSHAVADKRVTVDGLVFGSFPLHGAKKISTQRADHLISVSCPMLFLSGTRDELADADTLRGVVDQLALAQLHWLDTANHGYVVLKRKRMHTLTVFEEMAERMRRFMDGHLAASV